MTTHQRILHKLIQALLGLEWEYAVEERKERLPTGWLPLWSFQAPDCGGSAANVRIHELRSPEGTLGGRGLGIPVEHKTFHYEVNGKNRIIYAYKLALERDQLCFIDQAACRLNKPLLYARGYEQYETTEECGKGRAVRLRKQQQTNIGQTASLFA